MHSNQNLEVEVM